MSVQNLKSFAPLLSREELSLLHLGGTLRSDYNTGALRFSENHWQLEEGPTPPTLVGSRSATALEALLPSTLNALGYISTGASSTTPGLEDQTLDLHLATMRHPSTLLKYNNMRKT